MAFYQETRTMRAAVIGTIMPWSGTLSGIPAGWIICDGSSKEADEYPLLVQSIGDTYNLSGSGNLGGGFPNYSGQFTLPNLVDGRYLADYEVDYFVSGTGTDSPIELDSDARNLIEPFIGENTDNGVPIIFNDVFTDVEFTLNDRSGYAGNIKGNTIIPGQGIRPVFIGGRKLGNGHVRSHAHPGVYSTIDDSQRNRPGLGVIPYDNITATFNYASFDDRQIVSILGIPVDVTGPVGVDEARFGVEWYAPDGNTDIGSNNTWDSSFSSFSGFGGGLPGRTMAQVRGENPPVNLTPLFATFTPVVNFSEWTQRAIDSEDTINFGLFGQSFSIPQGFRNNYNTLPADPNDRYSTFVSNPQSAWQETDFPAHGHDPFDVVFNQNSLKPQPGLVASVNVPPQTLLDNASNVGALQINMNTSQPSLTCIYIIRAY